MEAPDWWDAKTYERLELPHLRWGNDLLAKCQVDEAATVLEIGCGTGRDTEKLAKRVPLGRVVAVDSSESMLAVARSVFGGTYGNIEFRHANILDPLGIDGSCDVAFSVATLHWVSDHEVAFRHIAEALKPGGLFLADCGGKGNIESVNEVVRSLCGPSDAFDVSHFEDASKTETRLVAAGFKIREVRLFKDPARFDSPELFKTFLATVVLGPHLAGLGVTDRDELLSEIVKRMPEFTVDYVRLRIDAVKL